jgi:hypothetical protein
MKSFAITLFFLAAVTWFFPGFNGILFEASNVSPGEGHILAAIFFVGGLVLWFKSAKK